MAVHILLLSLVISCSIFVVNSSITCRDNNNQPVDWFIIYKLPVKYSPESSHDARNESHRHKYDNRSNWDFPPHLYADANEESFVELTGSFNDTKRALYYTLQQAYDNHQSQEVGYVFYNDEKPISAGPDEDRFTCGHTKGFTVFDENSGIWLVHSAPKFPPPTKQSFSYPDNGVEYGQHFLCISLAHANDVENVGVSVFDSSSGLWLVHSAPKFPPIANTSFSYPENAVYYGQHFLCISLASSAAVADVGVQLLHNEPQIYDSNVPTALSTKYKAMYQVTHKHDRPIVPTNSVSLQTPGAETFISYAKGGEFGKDLYADLVAPGLKCNLSVSTWQHSNRYDRNLNASCSGPFKVFDVQSIEYKSDGINFRNWYDHSKFAVCQPTPEGVQSGWVCIGDINRQTAQLKRGGGTVCFQNKKMNSLYLSIISKTDNCSSKSNF